MTMYVMKFHLEKFKDENKLLCFYSQQLTLLH